MRPSAALTVHEPLKAGENEVLLTGDGEVLALEWEVGRGSRVLAIANGSFLLNLPLVNPARRPLAERSRRVDRRGAPAGCLR